MEDHLLSMETWLEILEALEDYYIEQKMNHEEKLVLYYSILGIMFRNDSLKTKANTIINKLNFFTKMNLFKDLAIILHTNNKLKDLSSFYLQEELQLIEENILLVSNQEISPYNVNNFLQLQKLFSIGEQKIFEKIIDLSMKSIQQMPRENQIRSYYNLTTNIIKYQRIENVQALNHLQ